MSDTDADLLGAVADIAQAEERVTVPKTETQKEDVSSTEQEATIDEQDFSRIPWDEREKPVEETSEPSKEKSETESETKTDTETETKTNTETKTSDEASKTEATEGEAGEEAAEEDVNAWLKQLPPAPTEFTLPAPEFDEDGQLTNMTGQEFINYTVQLAKHEAKVESYNDNALNRALDEAEKILPTIKTNPLHRQMVQNQYIAQTVNGESYNLVAAARDIRDLIGVTRAEGAQNAKTSITKQKSASSESPSTQQKATPNKVDKLAKRLKANDSAAYDELFSIWLDNGQA